MVGEQGDTTKLSSHKDNLDSKTVGGNQVTVCTIFIASLDVKQNNVLIMLLNSSGPMVLLPVLLMHHTSGKPLLLRKCVVYWCSSSYLKSKSQSSCYCYHTSRAVSLWRKTEACLS